MAREAGCGVELPQLGRLPERVANQIEPLRKLLEARQKLADLRNKAAGNDKSEDLLNDVLANTDKIAQLSKEAGPCPKSDSSLRGRTTGTSPELLIPNRQTN